MLRNYLKVALRNLVRNKIYSTINIAGLALGMAVALLIGLWVADEFNVNKNFGHYDKIVQILYNYRQGGHTFTSGGIPIALAKQLRKDYSDDFKSVAIMGGFGGHMLGFKDKNFGTEGSCYAEPGIINLLPVQMVSGGPKALDEPASMIIDQWLAKNLFGNVDPLNKMVRVDNQRTVRVTGVYEDFPHGSAFDQTHLIGSWAQYVAEDPSIKDFENRWDVNSFPVFAQLGDHVDIHQLSARVRNLMNGHGRTDRPEVLLYPMSRWHLFDNFNEGRNEGGSITFVRMFSLIGLFVLLLACVNFMNLSTARSERRAREVGIRKAVGSLRVHLIAQFLGESLIFCCFSLILALLVVQLVLPAFNRIADKNMLIPWSSGVFWMVMMGFTLFTGLIAGSYPAFYLSSFRPVKVLKGDLTRSRTRPSRWLGRSFTGGRSASLPRRVLVVLQFTVSIALIIGTLVISEEIQYAHARPMGYQWHGIIEVFRSTPELMQNYTIIRDNLLSNGGASKVALSTAPTTTLFGSASGFEWPGKDPAFTDNFGFLNISQNFGATIGWQIMEGRDFSTDLSSDSNALVINETAVKYMGLKHPIGTIIRRSRPSAGPASSLGSDAKGGSTTYRVIGVVKDMVMGSPFESTSPTMFSMHAPNQGLGVIVIKLNPSLPRAQALARVASVFKTYNPASSFDFWDNEERFGRNFIFEDRISALTSIFAILAILISCLGMFGLSSFTAERRTREIGLRKVLGASVPQLWGLLSKEFVLLVGLSFFIALPISYLYMHHWLQQFDYRVGISGWIFVSTIAGTLLITIITVSFQSIRASMANPGMTLRSE